MLCGPCPSAVSALTLCDLGDRALRAAIEDSNRAEGFVATALQVGKLALMARGLAGFTALGAWAGLHSVILFSNDTDYRHAVDVWLAHRDHA